MWGVACPTQLVGVAWLRCDKKKRREKKKWVNGQHPCQNRCFPPILRVLIYRRKVPSRTYTTYATLWPQRQHHSSDYYEEAPFGTLSLPYMFLSVVLLGWSRVSVALAFYLAARLAVRTARPFYFRQSVFISYFNFSRGAPREKRLQSVCPLMAGELPSCSVARAF